MDRKHSSFFFNSVAKPVECCSIPHYKQKKKAQHIVFDDLHEIQLIKIDFNSLPIYKRDQVEKIMGRMCAGSIDEPLKDLNFLNIKTPLHIYQALQIMLKITKDNNYEDNSTSFELLNIDRTRIQLISKFCNDETRAEQLLKIFKERYYYLDSENENYCNVSILYNEEDPTELSKILDLSLSKDNLKGAYVILMFHLSLFFIVSKNLKKVFPEMGKIANELIDKIIHLEKQNLITFSFLYAYALENTDRDKEFIQVLDKFNKEFEKQELQKVPKPEQYLKLENLLNKRKNQTV